jgi:hypothetical protein
MVEHPFRQPFRTTDKAKFANGKRPANLSCLFASASKTYSLVWEDYSRQPFEQAK